MSNPNADTNLDRILENAQLPALPQSAIRLLELSQDAKNGPADFAKPIEADPGLTGQVLKFVNSSYFGFSREISSIKLAITLVGIRTIKNFALWSAVFSLMPNPKCGPFDLKTLWQDSLRRGLFARAFGKLLGMKDAEEPFAAALLQDMAIPLLAKERPEVYAQLLEKRDGGKVRLSQLEMENFGWTHAQAGARMAQQWNLPEGFVKLIENHSSIDALAAATGAPQGELAVALSSLLPIGKDDVWHEASKFEALYRQLSPANAPPAAEFLGKIDTEFADFAPVLKVSTPACSLVESYQQQQAAAEAAV
jgi:HD-like signal output (HDOD) protein